MPPRERFAAEATATLELRDHAEAALAHRERKMSSALAAGSAGVSFFFFSSSLLLLLL